MEFEVSCPSGLKGVLRSLKVKDAQLFNDPKLQMRGDIIRTLLERCWVRTVEPGPYRMGKDFDWAQLLDGDAFYLFVQLRIQTYGGPYEYHAVCPACRKSTKQTVDLEKDLTVQPLPLASIEKFQSDQPFIVSVAGTKVGFKLRTLGDERHVDHMMETRGLTPNLAALVVSIVTLNGTPVTPGDALRFVEGLDAGDASDYEQYLDTVDCGVRTNVRASCRNCRANFELLLPFGPGFFAKPRDSSLNLNSEAGSTS